MRVVQRSGSRVRTALLCRRVGDPRLAHYDKAGNVLYASLKRPPAGPWSPRAAIAVTCDGASSPGY